MIFSRIYEYTFEGEDEKIASHYYRDLKSGRAGDTILILLPVTIHTASHVDPNRIFNGAERNMYFSSNRSNVAIRENMIYPLSKPPDFQLDQGKHGYTQRIDGLDSNKVKIIPQEFSLRNIKLHGYILTSSLSDRINGSIRG